MPWLCWILASVVGLVLVCAVVEILSARRAMKRRENWKR